jgi:hypothetical protein
MSWALKDSRNTRNLNGVSYRINWSSLKPGDMVLRGGHVRLFEKWANKSKTSFWIYEEGSTASDMNQYKVKVSKSKSGGYKPWRYNKVRDSLPVQRTDPGTMVARGPSVMRVGCLRRRPRDRLSITAALPSRGGLDTSSGCKWFRSVCRVDPRLPRST